MKKVLIVASVVSFIEWFNKENVVFLKDDLGCEVHIACNFDYIKDTDEDRTVKYVETLKQKGFILHNIEFARSPFSLSNLNTYKKLKSIIKNEKFDLIVLDIMMPELDGFSTCKEIKKQSPLPLIADMKVFHFL